MSGGTFMVSRGIWDHEEFMPSPFSEREAFLWLVSEASWKPRRKRVGKVVVDLDRGQLAHSTRFLADAWDWSHSKVRRFLDRLENRHMIRRASGTGVSVICVVNYDAYQASAQASDTAAAHKATQQRHSSGTNEKKDEIKGIRESRDTNVSLGQIGFDDFWQAYPRKVAKDGARKAWDKAVKRAPPEAIIAGAVAYAEVRQGQDKQYTAHPASWLNDGRWQDDFNALKASKDKAHGKRDGDAADRARRAGERWAARAMDIGSGGDVAGTLFSAGEPRRIAGSGD